MKVRRTDYIAPQILYITSHFRGEAFFRRNDGEGLPCRALGLYSGVDDKKFEGSRFGITMNDIFSICRLPKHRMGLNYLFIILTRTMNL